MSAHFARLALLALPALFACGRHGSGGITGPEYTLEQAADSIPLPYRATVKVGDVWLSLTDVPTDSRCPRDVTCVWEGDAQADIVVHPGCYDQGCEAASKHLSLHTTLDPRSGEALGYQVHLVALLPKPVSGRETPHAEYVAWVRLTR